jgi:folate-binding protein YgfZ
MRFRTKVEIETVDRTRTTVIGPGARSFAGLDQAIPGPASLSFGGTLDDVPLADVYEADPGSVAALAETPPADPHVYEILRIEAAAPAFGVDYGTENLPQEAGLTRAVSVEKGCYIGQETIARIHFRGHINKVVRPLVLRDVDASSAVGRELVHEGRKAGRVTSAVTSPRRGAIGLGMVSVDPATGSELEVDGGGTAAVGPIPAGTKVKAG